MRVVLASVNNKAYQPLADITCANKQAYANKYDYQTYFKNSNFKYIPNNELQSTPNNIGWEKINTIEEAFEKYPDTQWVWLSDCDSMITNSDIAIESIISRYDKEIIISCDRGGMNTGQILVKNTFPARDYLTTMLEKHSSYRDENQYIIENFNKDITTVIPQKLINSYDYHDHQEIRNTIYTSTNDSLGHDGQWRPGDFVIHWAAGNLNLRLGLAPLYQAFTDKKIDYPTMSAAIKKLY